MHVPVVRKNDPKAFDFVESNCWIHIAFALCTPTVEMQESRLTQNKK